MDKQSIITFQKRVKSNLYDRILPFWLTHTIDKDHGGFFGRITNDLKIQKTAPKGLILTSRILWTFSALYRFNPQPQYLEMTQRAYNYYLDRFLDREYGGAFWLLDFHGLVIDNKKKMYGQAFMIYALTEYFAATNNKESLDQAVELFRLIETHNYDKAYKGYYETSNRDWSISEDMRLSTVDMNEKKSLNTHLHLMEAYSNLYRVWKEPLVKIRLRELIRDFLDFIIDPDTYHFKLFFNEKWHSKSGTISFGHNIEGSWLLCEAAEILGDATLSKSVQQVALKIAQVVLDEGVNSNGAVYSDKDEKNVIAKEYCWWTQAEAVVGFLNAYQISHDDAFIRMALKVWNYIETHFVDTKYGEWYNELSENHHPNQNRYKVSEWKGPYHNSRACMEIMRRLDVLYK